MKKKAQLQIMENAFAMIIIFIILIIVGVFVFGVQKSDAAQKQKEFAELEVLKKSWILNFLPEMQCSDNNNIDPNCYDLLKISSFTRRLEVDGPSSDYYKSLLGYVNISVEWFDPSPGVDSQVAKWQIYDNPKKNNKGVRIIPMPVTLRDPVNGSDSNYFGIVYLGAYQ
jgi:hypothetical protein